MSQAGLVRLLAVALAVIPVEPSYQVDSDGKHWKVDKNAEYAFEGGARPPKPTASKAPTLFLGISGYRDSERCAKTLFFAFTQARWPEKLTIAVVEQVAASDSRCLDLYCEYTVKQRPDLAKGGACPYKSQIRLKTIDYSESKGPVYARALQGQLLQDEEFCMQVDSHTKFKHNFDELLLADWFRTENENAILTTYVHDISALGQQWAERVVPHVCKTQWGAWGTVRNSQAANIDFGGEPMGQRKPVLSITWAAGFSYGKCHFERNVPYDIHLKEVFDGEEFSRYARAWTRGYDTYTPSNNFVFHDYFKKMGKSDKAVWNYDPPKIDPTVRQAEERASSKRLAALLHMSTDESENSALDGSPYGLGSARTFEELVKFTGIETRSGGGHTKQASRGERCGTLRWKPFDPNAAPQAREAEGTTAAHAEEIIKPRMASILTRHHRKRKHGIRLRGHQQ